MLTARRDDLPRNQETEGYSVTRLDRVWMPWDSLGMSNPVLPTLYNTVRSWRGLDIVDAHSHLFWTSALAVRAAVDSGKPAITTVHGVFAQRDWLANLSQRAYILSVASWALRHSSRVVCLTESDADEIAQLGVGRSKIRVIPTAVDPDVYRTRKKEKSGTIVWGGRLVPEKGLETLLQAITILKRKRTVRLLIIGNGPSRNKLVGSAHKLGITDSVTFIPNLPRPKLAEVLSETGVFVIPSLKEGLPLTMLEAMASSNAIAASRLPSIEGVLGEAGAYFTPGNPNEIADVLSTLLGDDRSRRRKGEMARELIERRFSWRAVLPALEELYEEVLVD